MAMCIHCFAGAIFFFLAISFPVFSSQNIPVNQPASFFKVFMQGTNVWQVSSTDIVLYTPNSSTTRYISLSTFEENATIFDAATYDQTLWIVSNRGLFSIEMGTSTCTAIPFPDQSFSLCKVSVDIDYVWLFSGNVLWRFDKLAREWLDFKIPLAPQFSLVPLKVTSINDKVYCLFPQGTQVFSILEERWKFFLLQNDSISAPLLCINDNKEIAAFTANAVYQFVFESQTWDTTSLPLPIVDVTEDKNAYYLLTLHSVFSLRKSDGALRLLTINGLDQASAIAKTNDSTLAIADLNHLVWYNLANESKEVVPYPPNLVMLSGLKLFESGSLLIMRFEKNLIAFNSETNTWRTIAITRPEHKQPFTWSSEGASLNYAPGKRCSLRGEIGAQFSTSAKYDVDSSVIIGLKADTLANSNSANGYDINQHLLYDSTLFFSFKKPAFPTHLNLHSTFESNRSLDLFFDNTNVSTIPKKGLLYKGASSDVISLVTAFSNTYDQGKSQTLGALGFEGVSTEFRSPNKLAHRDRYIASANAGAGIITTQSNYKYVPYAETGTYCLVEEKDTLGKKLNPFAIVPGSLRLWIDGKEVDDESFSFVASTGDLVFQRRDLVNPTSLILAYFETQVVPDSGLDIVEMFPRNNYGEIGYLHTTISPTSWLSMLAGYVHIQDTMQHEIITASLPLEGRFSNPKVLVQCMPEVSIHSINKSKASACTFMGVLGERFSISAHGLMVDSAFSGTQSLSRGMGKLNYEAGLTAAFNPIQEIPIIYRHSQSSAKHGAYLSQEVSTSLRFDGFPQLDMDLSRISVSGRTNSSEAFGPESQPTQTDSIRMYKNQVELRMYELRSRFLQNVTHVKKIGYQLSYTQYDFTDSLHEKKGIGRNLYGALNIMPFNGLTLTGNGMQFDNGASIMHYGTITCQTIDLPRGLDLDALYSIDITKNNASDSSRFSQSQSIALITRPGNWIPFFSWISPRGGLSHNNKFLTGQMSTTNSANIGAHVTAGSFLLFRDENTWTFSDTSVSLRTFNDLKIWPMSGMLFQTRHELIATKGTESHSGYTRIDERWNRSLRTFTELAGTFKKSPSTSALLLGPTVTVVFTPPQFLMLRNLENSHAIKTRWKRENGIITPWYEISYLFTFQATIASNILLNTNSSFALLNHSFFDFHAATSLRLIL